MYLKIFRKYGLIAAISGSILSQAEIMYAQGEWTDAILEYNDKVVLLARYDPQTSINEVVTRDGPHEVHSLKLISVSKKPQFREVDKVISDIFSFDPGPVVEEKITYRWLMRCNNCGKNLHRTSHVTHRGLGGPVKKIGTVVQGNYSTFSTGEYKGNNDVCHNIKSTRTRVRKERLIFNENLALSLMEKFPKPESWANASTVNVAGYNYTITGIPFLNKNDPASYQRWKNDFPSLLHTANISDSNRNLTTLDFTALFSQFY